MKYKDYFTHLQEIDFNPRIKKDQPEEESAMIVYSTGIVEKVSPKNGTDFHYTELNEIVGGHFEIVYLRDGDKTYLMILNDEGKLKDLPINNIATSMYIDVTGRMDTIHGDVLICRMDQVQ